MRFCIAAGCLVLLVGAISVSHADVVLIDDNSRAVFDLTSSDGMKDWTVDGVDHMQQQWFWYRIGATGGESSIDTLTLDFSLTSNTNQDPNDDTLFVSYVGTGLKIETTYVLRGGTAGSGTADIGESIEIFNTGVNPLEIHFFQYCNFDLYGTQTDASVQITGENKNTVTQSDMGGYVAETVATPAADHHQVAYYPAILNDLIDVSPTTLSDLSGPLTNGDLAWAFQWDFTIAPGDSVLISKDKMIIPEPATLSLLAAGAILLGFRRRRRR